MRVPHECIAGKWQVRRDLLPIFIPPASEPGVKGAKIVRSPWIPGSGLRDVTVGSSYSRTHSPGPCRRKPNARWIADSANSRHVRNAQACGPGSRCRSLGQAMNSEQPLSVGPRAGVAAIKQFLLSPYVSAVLAMLFWAGSTVLVRYVRLEVPPMGARRFTP